MCIKVECRSNQGEFVHKVMGRVIIVKHKHKESLPTVVEGVKFSIHLSVFISPFFFVSATFLKLLHRISNKLCSYLQENLILKFSLNFASFKLRNCIYYMYYYLNWLSSQLLFLPKFYKNLLYIGWVSKNLMCKCANSLEMPILVRVFFFLRIIPFLTLLQCDQH